MHYALARTDSDASYQVYGKGDNAAEAEHDASRNIAGRWDADALTSNLLVLTREEAEQRGFVKPGAPVIWHDDDRHYVVEDHGRYHPLKIEQKIRNIAR